MASAMAGGVRALLVAGLLGLTMGRPVDPSHGNASAPAPDFSIHVFQVSGHSLLARLCSDLTPPPYGSMPLFSCRGGAKGHSSGLRAHCAPNRGGWQVGQGDSQLIRFPSGYTILNDIAEMNWNTCKGGELVAEQVLAITGSR